MRGANHLKRLGWRLTRRSRRASLVLMYHRVAEAARDPWELAVSPLHFEEHLQVLRSSYETAHGRDLIAAMHGDNLAGRAVVVTFDDGYADNLSVAKPLLERWGVKATFFVSTGMVGAPNEFWWDELERLLLAPGKLPRVLRLPSLDRAWDLHQDAEYSSQLAHEHRAWHVGRPSPTHRHQVYEELWRLLMKRPGPQREAALAELSTVAGAGRLARPSHRTMTSDELLLLDADELTEIGSHAVSHTALSVLPAVEQREEIEKSKATLEEVLGRPVSSLSYPNGECGPATPNLVRAAGYSAAFTTGYGLVTSATDQYRLPRVVPPDVDGDGFAKWMRRIFPPQPKT